tara:strand:+ start:2705 stop:2917 length:213 start_codon:yes stop_codon:yes gene_type:complete
MKELTAHDRYQERQRIAEEQHIQRAIQKAVQAEREAIAQSLDKQADFACDEIDRQWAQEMAAAVRARGQA